MGHQRGKWAERTNPARDASEWRNRTPPEPETHHVPVDRHHDSPPTHETRAELGIWLDASYTRAYRTAYLIVRDASDAEEAVQDAFLRVWRFRDALPEGPAREPWLYRVLVNSCHSLLRREIPRRDRRAEEDSSIRDRSLGPDQIAEARVAQANVAVAIRSLPDHLRVPVILRYWTGLSEREIAQAIGRRPGTVKSRLHEARRRLAEDPTLIALQAIDDDVARTAEEDAP